MKKKERELKELIVKLQERAKEAGGHMEERIHVLEQLLR